MNKIKSNVITIHPIKESFTRDELMHALAYGYKGRKDGLSHHDTLLNYKEANNL